MPLTQEDALKELQARVAIAGSLKIVTANHACGGGLHPSKLGFDQKKCSAFEYPLTSVNHQELQDVISLEGPDDGGYYKASSKEGSFTVGAPIALLKRLSEWQQ